MTTLEAALLGALAVAFGAAIWFAVLWDRASRAHGEAWELAREGQRLLAQRDAYAEAIAEAVADSYPEGSCPVGHLSIQLVNRDGDLVIRGQALVRA